jgi:hypothetical protein
MGGAECSLSDKNDRQVEISVLVVVRAETDALVIAVLGSMGAVAWQGTPHACQSARQREKV